MFRRLWIVFYVALPISICCNDVLLPSAATAVGTGNALCRSSRRGRAIAPLPQNVRGGGDASAHGSRNEVLLTQETDVPKHDDSERYSRQMYVLGARAHALVRTSNVIVDGPLRSGLLFECAKNLALSGVGTITILTDNSGKEEEQNDPTSKIHKTYHNEKLDDLGNAYTRATIGETGCDDILQYLQRLNPSLSISTISRSAFTAKCATRACLERTLGVAPETTVYLCIDRPESTQLTTNSLCRTLQIPFVSTETAGLFGRTFCDFGPEFVVLDPDGGTPRQTLLNRVELISNNVTTNNDLTNVLELMVFCVEESTHDVSRGDSIQFHWKQGSEHQHSDPIIGTVLDVKSPSQLIIRIQLNEERNSNKPLISHNLAQQINHSANYFSKLKQPISIPFLSMQDALDTAKKSASSGNHEPRQLFAIADLEKSSDIARRNALMACFNALERFALQHNKLPSSQNVQSCEDEKLFLQLIQKSEFFTSLFSRELNNIQQRQQKDFERIAKCFTRCSEGKLVPVQALMGAIAAQEALKAVSRLYCPIRQFLLYDCEELLHQGGIHQQEPLHLVQESIADRTGTKQASIPDTTRNSAPGLTAVLGQDLSQALQKTKIFVVGSGAIGCELLKNLAAIGVATDKRKGKIVLTDMDTIEKSNLSRQLLFRDSDVGTFKSIAAEKAVKLFNPQVRIESHTSKVGEGAANSAFDEDFWANRVDIVMNGLDNMEARLFMDKQCVQHGKGMIDAGTLGAMGNVQVVVPHQSESYGSSADPPEPSIPVCTLKNFPYEISHTIQGGNCILLVFRILLPPSALLYALLLLITFSRTVLIIMVQWARDLFDGLYSRRPMQVNNNIKAVLSMGIAEVVGILQDRLGEEVGMETAREIAEDLELSLEHLNDQADFMNSCVLWAIRLFYTMFVDSIRQLLHQHPEESLDEDGQPFWSKSRRMPRIIEYRVVDEDDAIQQEINGYIIKFVQNAARLRFETYYRNDDTFASTPSTSLVQSMLENTSLNDIYQCSDTVSRVAEKLNASKEKLEGCLLKVVEFEKDDQDNGHVAFVSAASNLRALNYGIMPVDMLETRRISGNIVPAMITTTALVSALSCIELFKLIKAAPLYLHRNAFVNLALPFFAFTSPLPAEPMVGLHGKTHTIWDRIIVNEGKNSALSGGIQLAELLRKVKKKTGGRVTSLYYGPYMIYADFLHADDDWVGTKPVFELVKEALMSDHNVDDTASGESGTLDMHSSVDVDNFDKKSFLELSGVVEDEETGEDAEIPPIRIKKWKGKNILS